MNRVLIITYYWPPSGGGGVQRWLKMVQFLPEYGVESVVCHPSNPDYPLVDETFLKEIPNEVETVAVPIFEPFRTVRNLLGKKKKRGISAGFIADGKQGRMVKILGYIRGNFFIPDARKFWVKPVVKQLETYLKSHPVEAIITTGPPHSVHFIGEQLRRKTGIPWVADFRDYWSDMDHADLFQLGKRAKQTHVRLEKRIVQNASRVVAVTPTMAEFYSRMRGAPADLITNGYDASDFERPVDLRENEFVIGHYGTLGADRFTPGLWDMLATLCEENTEFNERLNIELMGPTDASTLNYLRRGPLSGKLRYVHYTTHAEAVHHMRSAGVLLLQLNQNSSEAGRLPGKVFEYMAAGRPILGIGMPHSDAGRMLKESGCGEMLERGEEKGMKTFVLQAFNQELPFEPHAAYVQQFTRKSLAGKYADVVREVIEKPLNS